MNIHSHIFDCRKHYITQTMLPEALRHCSRHCWPKTTPVFALGNITSYFRLWHHKMVALNHAHVCSQKHYVGCDISPFSGITSLKQCSWKHYITAPGCDVTVDLKSHPYSLQEILYHSEHYSQMWSHQMKALNNAHVCSRKNYVTKTICDILNLHSCHCFVTLFPISFLCKQAKVDECMGRAHKCLLVILNGSL